MIVKRDTFPAIVTFTSGTNEHNLTICRVVLTSNEIIVVQDSGSGPIEVFHEPVIGIPIWDGKSGTVQTTSGITVHYEKDSACGCGSRLRSWNPYRNIVSSSQDPTE